MKIDLYTKTILTIIAISLFVISLHPLVKPVSVEAYGSGQSVTVTNYETDVKGGETLYVYCTNCG